jgi:cytochrome P450
VVTHAVDSAESAGGRLGAVLSAPRSGAFALGKHGPWVVATPSLARRVLTEPSLFDFPADVSRTRDLSGSRGDTRSGHVIFESLSPTQVEIGRTVFAEEWASVVQTHGGRSSTRPRDAMQLLRHPVARATTAATLPSLSREARDAVADAILRWIDALGPVIAARRPPGRFSRTRRAERIARQALEDTLGQLTESHRPTSEVATFLAAGVQVPIAAGAWLLALLADHCTGVVDPVHAVWETLRLTPPTWITARIATRDVTLGDAQVPGGSVVMVSPLLLGRREDLVPGVPGSIVNFDPDRWDDAVQRPGAWLPFGAGPHACPGRTLGLALLVEVARWGVAHELTLIERVRIDQSRGIAPRPCRFTATLRSEPPA